VSGRDTTFLLQADPNDVRAHAGLGEVRIEQRRYAEAETELLRAVALVLGTITVFYARGLGLGYLLFLAWPRAFVLAGFSYAESLLLVISVINIHHFLVDAFIWRLRRDPSYAAAASAS